MPGWQDHLPWVLLGLRAAPKEASGVSWTELVYGTPLSLPEEFVDAAAVFSEKMRISRVPPPPTRPLTYAQVVSKPSPGLETADFVYVCCGGAGPPLVLLYASLYEVVERQPKFFKLKMGGKLEVVSID